MRRVRIFGIAALLGLGAAWGSTPSRCASAASSPDGPERAGPPPHAAAHLPLIFEENRGQSDPAARFVVRGRGYTAWLSPGGAVFSLRGRAERGGRGPRARGDHRAEIPRHVVRMRFEGAAAAPMTGRDPLPGRSHYFIGSDASRWVTEAPHFGEAVVDAAYADVGVRWYGGSDARLRYDLVAAPGADVGRVQLAFDGADAVRVAANGDLVLSTPLGELRQDRPRAWQDKDGVRRAVEVSFAVAEDGRVRFALGAHDRARPLVIDPGFTWSTYLGGSAYEDPQAVAVDSTGACYVTGWVDGSGYPTSSGYQGSFGGGYYDAFLAKISASGNSVVYSTFLGGSNVDDTFGVAVDSAGAAYVTGETISTNYPTTTSTFQPSKSGSWDAFITKVGASGSTLEWSTFLGGSGTEYGAGIAVDGSGSAYICGETDSNNLPTQSAFQSSRSGSRDAFVAKFDASGASLAYSTYLGGSGSEDWTHIAVDGTGHAYVAGETSSSNFPTQSPVQASSGGGSDGFCTKLSASGSSLDWSTYIGGSGSDSPNGMGIDSAGAAYVVGSTTSSNFPAVAAMRSTKNAASSDGFVTKVAASGASFAYSTYFGGSGWSRLFEVALDPSGAAIVCGDTTDTNYPTANPEQSSMSGTGDGVVAKISADGSTLLRSTYVGGSASDYCTAVAIGLNGTVIVAGGTYSSDFPLAGATQTTWGGSQDAFLVRLAGWGAPVVTTPTPPAAPTNLAALYTPGSGVSLSWKDNSTDETGFRLERMPAGFAFSTLASLQPGTVAYVDRLLFPTTTYTYRVRAFNTAGDSAPSNEVSITTTSAEAIPTPPKAPSKLSASLDGAAIDLTWTDNSADEVHFDLERADGGAAYRRVASTEADEIEALDAAVRPGWPYSYRVRALGLQGPSPWSNVASASLPATLAVAPGAGSLTDSAKLHKDKLKLAATLADDETLDVVANGLALQAGPSNAPVVLSIPPGDAAWKSRKGKLTWKSAKGAVPKVTVALDPAKHVLSVSVSAFDFAAPPEASVTLLVASGASGGAGAATWTERKPGSLRSP